jgi:hypothetical protein
MSAQTPRFLVENIGGNTPNFELALAEAVKYCSSNGIEHIVLVVPSKGHFLGGVIAESLGKQGAKSLHAGHALKISGTNISMTLAHPGSIATVPVTALLLSAHLSTSDMRKVDDSLSPSAIVFLPWSDAEGKEWLSTWQPSIWGSSTWQVAAPTMDPAVTAALEDLQRHVNVTTGLPHPTDKRAANEAFKALKQGGHQIDADEVRKWALRNDWDQRGAAELAAVAKKY